MNEQKDALLDTYLWDPSTEPHRAVVAVEQRLGVLRFDATARPFVAPVQRSRPEERWALWRLLAAAAALAMAAGGAISTWRWSWPEGGSWAVEQRGAGAAGRFDVGSTLRTAEPALVRVARIGTMRVAPGSAVTLDSTSSNRHRLTVQQGSVHLRVWAPPFSVVIQTPAGAVADLGCEFDLRVDGAAAHVRVTSGWVLLENEYGESLVPEGASAPMRAGQRPGVPVFDDASAALRDLVRALEDGRGDLGDAAAGIARLARPRDVLTLLMLTKQGVEAGPLARRAAELWPPPREVSVERILRGDENALWRWRDTLPLPPPKKQWWRNWRDALPLRVSSTSC